MATAPNLQRSPLPHYEIIRDSINQYLPGYKIFVQNKEKENTSKEISFLLADGGKKQYICADVNKKQVVLSDEPINNQELFISSKNSTLASKNNKLRLTFYITDTSGGHFLAAAYMPESPSEGEKLPLELSENITSLLTLPSEHAVFSLTERVLPTVLGNTSSVDSRCNSDWILTGRDGVYSFGNLDSEMHHNYWKLGDGVSLTRIYGHALTLLII